MNTTKLNITVEELASFLAGDIADMSSGGHFARYQRAFPLARRMLAADALYDNLRDLLKVYENHWKVDREIYIQHAQAALAQADGDVRK